ncbi:hypothetical protein [Actinacidiphila reveromycinica]|uniref:hypothetical protein n=1 Tax=Actinacidiphila reveromycinica TaxID=659352 RepID=UPI0019226142|nr:hypothetical protein [Streptomyces sp. SN-593]
MSHAPAGAAPEQAGQAVPFVTAGRPVPRVLPLGAGLVLVGLGLGFLGWRLRRP